MTAAPDARKPRVLAIDDDPDFRKALELVITRFGLQIEGVSEPQEFIRRAETSSYDLYLIDLQLGQTDGFSLIDKLRLEKGPKAAIVVISGAKQASSIAHALELGASDYITKPLDRTFLASKLARFFKTEQIESNRSALHDFPKGQSPAQIAAEARIIEVDEMGIKMTSRCLVPKGTSFKMSSELFNQITEGKTRDCLVTVVDTWLDPDTQLYGHYAEFESADNDFFQKVRRWLTLTSN